LQTRIVGTSAPAPITGTPAVISSTGTNFVGTVVPNGSATVAYFQYSLDSKYSSEADNLYDQSTSPQQVGSDFSSHQVSAFVGGLVPNAVYHVRLVASNGAGTMYGPDQVFTTKSDPPPAPPVLGQSFNIKPVSGLVLVKFPGSHAADPTASAALAKGLGFVPLTELRSIPAGSEIDARRGTIQLAAAPSVRHGKLQKGTFTGGIYKLSQDRRGLTKGTTNLVLQEGAFRGAPSYASCPRGAADGPAAQTARLSSRVLQTLRGNAHGHFRTRGRYSAATVRGTIWGVRDRCDGTLTVVTRGVVAVQDFVRHITVLVHGGHQYLARKK
jgi:hypothetical protein